MELYGRENVALSSRDPHEPDASAPCQLVAYFAGVVCSICTMDTPSTLVDDVDNGATAVLPCNLTTRHGEHYSRNNPFDIQAC